MQADFLTAFWYIDPCNPRLSSVQQVMNEIDEWPIGYNRLEEWLVSLRRAAVGSLLDSRSGNLNADMSHGRVTSHDELPDSSSHAHAIPTNSAELIASVPSPIDGSTNHPVLAGPHPTRARIYRSANLAHTEEQHPSPAMTPASDGSDASRRSVSSVSDYLHLRGILTTDPSKHVRRNATQARQTQDETHISGAMKSAVHLPDRGELLHSVLVYDTCIGCTQ